MSNKRFFKSDVFSPILNTNYRLFQEDRESDVPCVVYLKDELPFEGLWSYRPFAWSACDSPINTKIYLLAELSSSWMA